MPPSPDDANGGVLEGNSLRLAFESSRQPMHAPMCCEKRLVRWVSPITWEVGSAPFLVMNRSIMDAVAYQ